jgi:pentatricopeptide repeat protein
LKGGKWKCALELLKEMRERALKPDVISCNAGTVACEKGSTGERAVKLLRK